jgi:hypothetical protein
MAVAVRRRRFTLDEFERMRGVFGEEGRVEPIEAENPLGGRGGQARKWLTVETKASGAS